jgi:hypothetical protein
MSAQASRHRMSACLSSKGESHASSSITMTAPHYISEKNKSDMRSVKHGWCAIEDDGNLSSGHFPAARNASKESLSRRTGRSRLRAATRAVLYRFSTDIRRLGRRQEVYPKPLSKG